MQQRLIAVEMSPLAVNNVDYGNSISHPCMIRLHLQFDTNVFERKKACIFLSRWLSGVFLRQKE